MNVTIVAYHHVRPVSDVTFPRLPALRLEQFVAQLDYIQQEFSLVSLHHIVRAVRGEATLPSHAAALTFDDGYAAHYSLVFPELQRRGVTGAFFLSTSAVTGRRVMKVNKIQFILAVCPNPESIIRTIEDEVRLAAKSRTLPTVEELRRTYFHASWLDRAEVRYLKNLLQKGLPPDLSARLVDVLFDELVTRDETTFAEALYLTAPEAREMLAAGMEIGGHGGRHEWLNAMSADQQRDDIGDSLALLSSFGIDRDFLFGYPYGGYNADTLAILRDAGCAAAVTAEPRVADLARDAILELPRLDTIHLPLAAPDESRLGADA